MRILHLITHQSWQIEELQTEGWVIDHSWGFDIPQYSKDDAWRLPQAQAVQLIHSIEHHGLPAVKFTAPTPDLLQSLPQEMTGRKIQTMKVADFLGALIPWDEPLWWKLATAKHEHFSAGIRTHDELEELVEELNLPMDAILQCSTELSDILFEYRAFIHQDRKTKQYILGAGSEYLVEGVTVYDGASISEEQNKQVVGYLDQFLDYVDKTQGFPPAFVVDFAFTQTDGYVLEFNPAWCSGWYNGKASGVLETINRGFQVSKKELKAWGYEPDPALVMIYGNRRPWGPPR